MVKAGVANFLMNFTAKPSIEEEVVVTQVGDCDEVERYLRLPEIHVVTSHVAKIAAAKRAVFSPVRWMVIDAIRTLNRWPQPKIPVERGGGT